MEQSITPTPAHERIDLFDILRGFALLGILIVNMGIFSFPYIAQLTRTPRGDSVLDYATEFLIMALATWKFYPLFSFLFGLGMWMQIERIQAVGGNPGRFMVRRLLVLMGFGLIHALLIWNGDILFVYALVGLVALLFRKVQPRTLLIWAGVLVAIPVIFGTGFVALGTLLAGDMSGAAEGMAMFRDLEQRTIEIYARGSWGEIFVWRTIEWLLFQFFLFLNGGMLQILALFLIGMYFGKRQIFQRLNEKPASERRLPAGSVCLVAGLTVNLVLAWQIQVTNPLSPLAGLWPVLILVAGPILSYGYLALFVALTSTAAWRRRLQPLAAVGRMALSNYILQSIICTLIFYSYGLGLFGQVGAFAGLLISIVIWVGQIGISRLWLRHFQYGPLEWVWRSLTYGKTQRITLEASHPSTL